MADEGLLDLVRQHMRSVRVPGHHDKVYKDECMFSFDTPLSAGGLFLNLSTWQAFSERHLPLDAERNGNKLYLWEKWHKVPLTEEERAAQKAKPEKMAIGGDGGFQVDAADHKIEKESALVVLPGRERIPLPCPDLPELVINAINAIVAHDSASKQEEVAVWEEERRESRYARDLVQLPAERKVPADPALWKCDDTGVTENLWLNLSTGHIGSGRQQWGGTGGTGAALQHFQDTGGKYPLAVKLGTITPHGADVYSYAPDEDDMVTDPLLGDHLAHWGINMLQMSKTEKTMAELEIDQNVKFEWDRITEAGAELQPLSGPGYVGLKNLGNSCYMNSVLQVMWTVPLLKQRYVDPAEAIFRSAPANPADDFPSQMAKVGRALLDGDTGDQVEAVPADNTTAGGGDSAVAANAAVTGGVGGQQAVKPQFFKALAGKGHQEFSSGRQQDALEYFQHLLELMTRAERAAGSRLGGGDVSAAGPSAEVFSFQLEDRKQDVETRRVRYRRYVEGPPVSLSIPLDAAVNKDELEDYKDRERKRQKLADEAADAYIGAGDLINGGGGASVVSPADEEPVKPQVPFAACLEKWAAPELLEGVAGASGAKRSVLRQTRFATFPPYLLVQMRRYYTGEGWVPKKLDVLVEAPESLSLEHLRATGLQPGEEEDPEVEDTPSAAAAGGGQAAAAVEPDPAIVAQLMSMGFGENGSKRAVIATQNASAEVSMEWVLAHMEDADFNDPLPSPAAGGGAQTAAESSGAGGADPKSVVLLSSMGFTDAQATAALKACSGSVERAADWLFSHADDLDAAIAAVSSAGGATSTAGPADAAAAARLNDGRGEYSLVGFISHMGANTACGHYVAHIRKEGRWVIYNDEKVAASAKPPKALGYLYLYMRTTVEVRPASVNESLEVAAPTNG